MRRFDSCPPSHFKESMKNCTKHPDAKMLNLKNRTNPRCSKCASESVQRRREKLKKMAVEYKGNHCEKCGYGKCIWSLDFHHLDPSKKDFGISRKGHTISWDRIKTELDKCIMVCKNCHTEIHHDLHKRGVVA